MLIIRAIVRAHCSLFPKRRGTDTFLSNDDGTWRSDVFYNTLGETFVPVALNSAKQADPNTKLYINDYNIETAGAKSTSMQNLVTELKNNGTPM